MLRAIKRLFKRPIPVRASWENTPLALNDLTAFLNWFDDADSVQGALERAKADWSFRFAGHSEYKAVARDCALEIGFGGGRLMLQACRDFSSVIGVDIHAAFPMAERFLRSHGCENFSLLHRDHIGRIADESVDFVYSFIVFQHFDSMDEVRYYIDHISRVLKPGGYAHIYFGRNEGCGAKIVSDRDFKLRDRSLLVDPGFMAGEIARTFEILDVQDNLPKDPITKQGRSGQFFVKFKRSH